ncbi:hypothetical protein F2Q70_00012159 [Brassica cretica]|uniref:Uncharacterized protein n=1 Tax=Brassica cretica TaxID=69181 RepID=A0A8S9MEJ1_BRACR|nr:hypothetical protein F2Q70_00012159 [Brassica cretica]KAF3551815.1 hypothetical protein DY000_02007987 [Brassica cretica]
MRFVHMVTWRTGSHWIHMLMRRMILILWSREYHSFWRSIVLRRSTTTNSPPPSITTIVVYELLLFSVFFFAAPSPDGR